MAGKTQVLTWRPHDPQLGSLIGYREIQHAFGLIVK